MFNIAEIYLKSIAVISQLSLQSNISLFQKELKRGKQTIDPLACMSK